MTKGFSDTTTKGFNATGISNKHTRKHATEEND